MASLTLWLDTYEARLFHFLPAGMRSERLERSGARHPVESLGVNHPIAQTDEEKFYHRLANRLAEVDATEILLLGPGPARAHFVTHLERHHPNLVRRICGNMKLERMTDPQIVDFGKDYFRQHHLFAGTP